MQQGKIRLYGIDLIRFLANTNNVAHHSDYKKYVASWVANRLEEYDLSNQESYTLEKPHDFTIDFEESIIVSRLHIKKHQITKRYELEVSQLSQCMLRSWRHVVIYVCLILRYDELRGYAALPWHMIPIGHRTIMQPTRDDFFTISSRPIGRYLPQLSVD